jgi:hypothetical protein
MNILCRFAPYLDRPPGGPHWQLRIVVAMPFPK